MNTRFQIAVLTNLLWCWLLPAPGLAAPADPALALRELQAETRRQLNEGEFDAAIANLAEMRQSPEPEIRRFAQEFLGVARERKGQPEFARAEYQRFLEEFPTAPEADRVRMRLDALLFDNLPAAKSRTDVSRAEVTIPESRVARSVSGQIGVDYRGSRNEDDAGDTATTLSIVGTDVDLSTLSAGGTGDFTTRLSLGRYQDLLPDSNRTYDSIRYLYADYRKDHGLGARLGRQRARIPIMGRYDGLDLRYRFNGGPEISLFGGLPVDSSKTGLFEDKRRFYGLSVETGELWARLRLGLHGVYQSLDGMIDRQAIGADVVFADGGLFAEAAVDYDLHFQEVNAILININRVSGPSTWSASWNLRKSPSLSIRNALIGQPMDSLAELQRLLSPGEELEQLALDRSVDTQFASLAWGSALTDRTSISSTLSWVSTGGGGASGGVTASPVEEQKAIDVRFTFSDLFFDHHSLMLGVRYASQDDMDSGSLLISTYNGSGARWKFTPRVRFDMRNNTSGSSQMQIAPSFRLAYQVQHHALFLESGYLLYHNKYPSRHDQQYSILYGYFGYEYRF